MSAPDDTGYDRHYNALLPIYHRCECALFDGNLRELWPLLRLLVQLAGLCVGCDAGSCTASAHRHTIVANLPGLTCVFFNSRIWLVSA